MATTRKTKVSAPKRTLQKIAAPPLPRAEPSREAQEQALLAAGAALEKKAIDVEIIDVAGKVSYADYLVLMTGTSDRHVASLVQNIEEALQKRKVSLLSVEGMPAGNWVLIDTGDVVIHVFQEDSRGLYDLGGLWMDASRIPLPERAQKALL